MKTISVKNVAIALICLGGLSEIAPGAYGQAANVNPRQLALMKWFAGNQAATFSVGGNPNCLAFDGHNIWIGDQASNTVKKIAASDGSALGTFPVGNGPQAIAHDGTNIWVTNIKGNNVTKLRASDGALLGTFPTGPQPYGIAFDGANIWIANYGSNTVT